MSAFLRRQIEQSHVVSSGKSVSISKRTAPQWQLPLIVCRGRDPMSLTPAARRRGKRQRQTRGCTVALPVDLDRIAIRIGAPERDQRIVFVHRLDDGNAGRAHPRVQIDDGMRGRQPIAEVKPWRHRGGRGVVHQREIESPVVGHEREAITASKDGHSHPSRVERLRDGPVAHVKVEVIEFDGFASSIRWRLSTSMRRRRSLPSRVYSISRAVVVAFVHSAFYRRTPFRQAVHRSPCAQRQSLRSRP